MSKIDELFLNSIINHKAFVAYRNPFEESFKYFNTSNLSSFNATQFENKTQKGFAFCAFNNENENYFLEAENQYSSPQEILNLSANFDFFKSLPSNNSIYPTDKAQFVATVNKAIDQIQAQTLQKVVVSRTYSVPYTYIYHPLNHFSRLASKYPNAFVSIVYIPNKFCWIGATPELLAEYQSNGDFKTVALAGTQSYPPGMNPKEAIWRQKEIEEQALVSRYIISCFKKIRVRDFEEHGPKTIIAGKLMHLKTEFYANAEKVNYPYLASEMLTLLHPTSAVNGMPRANALEFIEANENYTRQYFAGFLGPINQSVKAGIDTVSNLYVNIRCMQLFQNEAICYAGAGITEDSDAEKEWDETALKMQTILDLF